MWTDKGFFKENVLKWLDFSGKTRNELADLLFMKQPYFSNLMGKRSLSFDNLRKFADLLSVQPATRLIEEQIDWANLEKDNYQFITKPQPKYETIPLYNIKASAGYVNEWAGMGDFESVNKNLFSKSVDFAIEVEGDSMTTTENAICIPDKSLLGCTALGSFGNPELGSIYLVAYRDGQPMVKVFKELRDDAIVLSSLNTDYEDCEIELAFAPQFFKVREIIKRQVL